MKPADFFQQQHRAPALMTHVVAGFPDLEKSKEIVRMMDASGADVIEIQIPFSDPVADGPTMQKCNELALERGFRVTSAFAMAKELSAEIKAPLLFMTYYNIVFKYGVEKFCAAAQASGVRGLIVPDMPVDEEPHEHLLDKCKKYGLDWIPVVSPLTSEVRIKQLANHAGGFWYLVSRTGVTGVTDTFSDETKEQITNIKKYSKLPIAMAFGVSKPDHIRRIGQIAEMAVVGSYIQNIFLHDAIDFKDRLHEAMDKLMELDGAKS